MSGQRVETPAAQDGGGHGPQAVPTQLQLLQLLQARQLTAGGGAGRMWWREGREERRGEERRRSREVRVEEERVGRRMRGKWVRMREE